MSAFDKVIGYDSIKEELMKFCDMMKNKEAYAKLGARPPHGILIYGEPGLGKTLMAKCLIEESGLKSYTLRRNKGNDDFVANITDTFTLAKENEPSIVFLDDMDKFANEDEAHKNAMEYVAIQAGIDDVKESDVYVIATGNEVWMLPRSLRRPGRFDVQVAVEAPEDRDADDIIKYYLKDKPLAGDVDLSDLTKMMFYSSCAELEGVLNIAAINAGRKRKEKIEMADLVHAVLRTQYEFSGGHLDKDSDVNKKIALHEAGHLVVCEQLCPGSVGLAAVNPAVNEPAGLVHRCMRLPHWDDYVLVSLAGKTAVELYYSDDTMIGCSDDIESAYTTIRDKMAENGTLGVGMIDVTTKRFERTSESLLARGEAATHAEMEKYIAMARKILLGNKAFLEETARELLDKGTLLHSDIRRIREKYVSGDDNSPRCTEFGTKLS